MDNIEYANKFVKTVTCKNETAVGNDGHNTFVTQDKFFIIIPNEIHQSKYALTYVSDFLNNKTSYGEVDLWFGGHDPRTIECDICAGIGYVSTCHECDGSGEVECGECGNIYECEECNGIGYYSSNKKEKECPKCIKGRVEIQEETNILGFKFDNNIIFRLKMNGVRQGIVKKMNFKRNILYVLTGMLNNGLIWGLFENHRCDLNQNYNDIFMEIK